jgi:hypothetical protein
MTLIRTRPARNLSHAALTSRARARYHGEPAIPTADAPRRRLGHASAESARRAPRSTPHSIKKVPL